MQFTPEILTAGKCVFTVEVPEGFRLDKDEVKPHYTYRVKLAKGKPDSKWKNDSWFVGLLTGPDNTRDFTYLGKLIPETGEVRLTDKSQFKEESWPVRILRKVTGRIWDGNTQAIRDAGWELHHEGRCVRCGRPLTVPSSVESGIGPECASKMAA